MDTNIFIMTAVSGIVIVCSNLLSEPEQCTSFNQIAPLPSVTRDAGCIFPELNIHIYKFTWSIRYFHIFIWIYVFIYTIFSLKMHYCCIETIHNWTVGMQIIVDSWNEWMKEWQKNWRKEICVWRFSVRCYFFLINVQYIIHLKAFVFQVHLCSLRIYTQEFHKVLYSVL